MRQLGCSSNSTLQFSEGDERAGECDSADEGTEEEGGLNDVGSGVRVKVALLEEEVGKAGEYGGGPDQTVEERYHLRQICHLNSFSGYRTDQSS